MSLTKEKIEEYLELRDRRTRYQNATYIFFFLAIVFFALWSKTDIFKMGIGDWASLWIWIALVLIAVIYFALNAFYTWRTRSMKFELELDLLTDEEFEKKCKDLGVYEDDKEE